LARKLKHIVFPLKAFLDTRRTFKLPGAQEGAGLSPLLEIRKRRGEALLVEAFFNFMEAANVADPSRQLELWDTLISKGGYILDLAQRIGLMNCFTTLPTKKPEQAAYVAWCIFLDSLRRENDTNLKNIATKSLFKHYFIGLYPEKNIKKKENLLTLRRRLEGKLRRHWGLNMELKESFTTENDSCEFSIRIKPYEEPQQTLITHTGTRLKPTKIEAYNFLLKGISEGMYRPEK
jgi:hypothetical protein